MVFAFAGDSTINRFFAILNYTAFRIAGQFFIYKYFINVIWVIPFKDHPILNSLLAILV